MDQMTETTFNEDDREETQVIPEPDDDEPDSGDEPYDPEEEESPVNTPGDTSVGGEQHEYEHNEEQEEDE